MLSWRIALRYLVSKKSHGAVNIISIVAVAGVAVATAAIVVVLSVFNGFTALAETQLAAIDPDFKVVPAVGKTFANGDSLALALRQVHGIAAAEPVVEERALAIYDDSQAPIVFKGVSPAYAAVAQLDSTVIDGSWLPDAYGYPAMLSGTGMAISTGARPSHASLVGVYVPLRAGRINPANPANAFRSQQLMLTGVFQVNQPDYDNDHVFIPLDVARDLLEYEAEATQIELAMAPGASEGKVAAALREAVGSAAVVLTRAQQEQNAYRMIQIEKWMSFLLLGFIAVIAAFNIVSTMSLLVIEKRDNMSTLRAMGASRAMTSSIFATQGWMITMAGGVLGIALGAALALAQQWGGFIKLNGDPSQLAIDTYPVHVSGADLLAVLALVAVIALATSMIAKFSNK